MSMNIHTHPDIIASLNDEILRLKARAEAAEREHDALREALLRCCEELEQWHDAKHVLAIARTALEAKP